MEKRKKISIRILFTVLLGMIVVIALGLIFYVRQIDYIGNKHYTAEEMNRYLFGTDHPNVLLYKIIGFKNDEIPFIQKCDVRIDWPNKMEVTVYEKSIVGYIDYMGGRMYFDKDGIVVESSSEVYEGVPEISGLQFRSIVLDSKLDVGNDAVFDRILEITQAFDKYDMNVSKVYFDTQYNATLYIGNVRVVLGDSAESTDRLYVLKQMYPKLAGLSGTLYLDDYDGDTKSIIFKKN